MNRFILKAFLLVKNTLNKVFQKLKRKKLNQNIFTFFFFLILSVIFWFLNALNEKYVSNISFPLKYINLPKDKMTFDKMQSTIDVKVAAFGYDFLDYKISAKEPIIIDFNVSKLHQVKNQKKRYYILTNFIKSNIANALGENIEVKKIIKDSIIFNFEEIIKKKVPIRSNIDLKLEKQYMLVDSISLVPDSLFIRGLKSDLDTINEVFTVYKEVKNVNDSISFKIKLKEIENIAFQNKYITCNAVAEEFTEMQFEVPIEQINLPKNTTVKLFPSIVKVAFNVGFSNYDKILLNNFKFVIDFSEIDINQEEKFHIKLVKLPKEVYLVRYYPKKVDYIIEKND